MLSSHQDPRNTAGALAADNLGKTGQAWVELLALWVLEHIKNTFGAQCDEILCNMFLADLHLGCEIASLCCQAPGHSAGAPRRKDKAKRAEAMQVCVKRSLQVVP